MLCFCFCFCFLKICIIIQWYVLSVFWKKWRSVLFFTWLCCSSVRNYMHIFTGSPVFDGLLHVIKSLIILIASFVRGYIMMLKLHEWSQETRSKNVIFKCKNYVPHLLFYVQTVLFRNSFFRHLYKALIIFQIWQGYIVQIHISITSLRLLPSFRPVFDNQC
jgi:hypothetical protein